MRLTAELTQRAAGYEQNRKAMAGPKRAALKLPPFSGNGALSSDATNRKTAHLFFFQLSWRLHEVNGRLVVRSLAGRFIDLLAAW